MVQNVSTIIDNFIPGFHPYMEQSSFSMVENAIVFGNRFRSTHAQMDSDLTRAELCFQNGEYTRALKIAIQAIENMHPGIYEKLVAQKDPAVMNQVQ